MLRNALRGPGYFRIGHASSPDEFVHDDHVAVGVTYACAMTRISLWERLGGLEDRYMPNGLGDIDMCLRAQKAGYASFYLGTIEGIHHESKTRGEATEDLELYMLYQRHGGALLDARARFMSYNSYLGWNGLTGASDTGEFALDIPLRYRTVDRLNNILKRSFRPLHGLVKGLFR